MFSSEFTCETCGYRSEHLLTACPACGGGAPATPETLTAKRQPETDAAGNYTAAQMEKWTGVPQNADARAQHRVKTFQVLRTLSGVGALCALFLLVPFYLIPVAGGQDNLGYYTYPKGRSSGPRKVSPDGLRFGVLLILISGAAFGGGYFYFTRKHGNADAEYSSSPGENKIF